MEFNQVLKQKTKLMIHSLKDIKENLTKQSIQSSLSKGEEAVFSFEYNLKFQKMFQKYIKDINIVF